MENNDRAKEGAPKSVLGGEKCIPLHDEERVLQVINKACRGSEDALLRLFLTTLDGVCGVSSSPKVSRNIIVGITGSIHHDNSLEIFAGLAGMEHPCFVVGSVPDERKKISDGLGSIIQENLPPLIVAFEKPFDGDSGEVDDCVKQEAIRNKFLERKTSGKRKRFTGTIRGSQES